MQYVVLSQQQTTSIKQLYLSIRNVLHDP